jgi:hypothetical protein
MKKVLITGCAKSGTTLLQRLFFSYYKVAVLQNETDLHELCLMPPGPPEFEYLVAKRTYRTIFSAELTDEQIRHQAKTILNEDIIVLNMVRGKTDILASSDGYVTEDRYNACMHQYGQWRGLVRLHVVYEDLIRDPNYTQAMIASRLGLSSKNKFSDYPDFVPEGMFRESMGPQYSKRRIGEDYVLVSEEEGGEPAIPDAASERVADDGGIQPVSGEAARDSSPV